MIDLLDGASGAAGTSVKMGRLGETKIGADGEAVMAEPFTFDKSNIDKYAKLF